MRLDRRLFMGLLAKLGIVLGLRPAFAAKPAGPVLSEVAVRRTLSAYLDTLIPDDDLGPGIIRLGLDKAFFTLASRYPRYGSFLTAGCVWLNEQARKADAEEFATLDERGRDAIVVLASKAPRRSLPRRFFQSTRGSAFRLYYGKSESWAAIGYGGPPQPGGFPDYAEAPRKMP